jgi:hypothetical protein
VALNWLRDNARDRGHESLEAPRPGRRNRQLADDTVPIDEWLIVHGLREKMQQAVRSLLCRAYVALRIRLAGLESRV